MKTHFYKNLNNSDVDFSGKLESILYSVLPEESLVTEDIVFKIYDMKRNEKPSEYPSMSRSSISQYLKLLGDKKFIKSYSPQELRTRLKLGR